MLAGEGARRGKQRGGRQPRPKVHRKQGQRRKALSSGMEEEGIRAPHDVEPLAPRDGGPKQGWPVGLCHREGDEDDGPDSVCHSLC
jgi:hypothetical protein